MALLTKYCDQRTIASIGVGGSSTFAHGLGLSATSQTNQMVVIANIASFGASSASVAMLSAVWDSANVTLSNGGNAATGTINVLSMWLAGFIQ